jgi:hypothetical protein
MSRVAQGGTQMWCPSCEAVTVCAAVNPSTLGNPSGQRWYLKNHSDIQWFRRGRICQTCDHEFLTAEVDEQFVGELVELRDALREIKLNAEAYVKESAAASKTLAKLGGSLSVLRALKIYKDENG